MTDLMGPSTNAPNVTVTRPPDTRVFGAGDTWIKDCSTPTAQDGTAIQAGWLNGLLAQLRALIRGNGQTAALADIVGIDNTDDTMALKAIQQLIQRGQMKFAIDSGAADALVVALNPALAEYKAGVSIKVLVAHDGTGPATVNVNGLGARAILRRDGSVLQARDLRAGAVATFDDDGNHFQLADIAPGSSNAAQIVTVSGALNLTLQQRAIALFRTAAPAAMAVNLPAGAANNATFVIDDVAGNLQPYPVTVGLLGGGGESIAGAATYVMNRNFQSTTFRLYDNGVTRIWSRST